MRFLHTSDWHLGMMLRNGITYYEDQKFFVEEIVRIALEQKVDGIIIAGDIFDKSIASREGLKLYDDAMTRICVDNRIPVYIVAGNHDGAERLSSCSRLLEASGLHIAGSLTDEPYVVNNGDVDIYMLPWISTDKVKSVYHDDADKVESLEDAYQIVLDKYRDGFVKGHKNILVSHAFIVNAVTSVSDRAAEVGRATMIASRVFDGFDYVALGHIHGPQSVNDRIVYCGSPMAYSFGKEEKQIKSVAIYDTSLDTVEIIPVKALRSRVTLSGTYDELMNSGIDDSVRNGFIRLEVTDSYVGLDSIALFREKFPNLLEISSRNFEKADAKITMTIDELDEASNDPQTIFNRYCEDILEAKPSEHFIKLFRNAMKEYEKED